MMDIFLIILLIAWIAGFVRELAHMHYALKKSGTEYPSPGVKWVMPIMLFFMWPYFYFYK